MLNSKEMTDKAIAQELGEWIKKIRLSKPGGGITQAALAKRAGVNRSTVVALEQGRGKLETLIPVLRSLDALEFLNNLAPPSDISPLQLARRQGSKRKRASSKQAAIGGTHDDHKNHETDW